MPKKRVIDLTTKVAVGTDVVLVANDYDTFNVKIETLPINTTLVKADGSTFARSLGERFAEIVNVKDFGAVGDGYTNDGPAINDAFLNANGKTVYFPSGVYALAVGEINLCSVVNIVGYNATIKQTSSNTPCFRADLTTTATVTIEGLKFVGVGLSDISTLTELPLDEGAHGCGIMLKNATNCIIRDCTFESFKNVGLFIVNGVNILIENCTFTGTRPLQGDANFDRNKNIKQYGIVLQSTSVDYLGDCKILNNDIRNAYNGIYIDEKYLNTTICGNIIKNVGVYGVRVNPASVLNVSDNIISALEEGISVVQEILELDQKVDHINIYNNTVSDGLNGITIHVTNSARARTHSSFYIRNVNITNNIIKDLARYDNYACAGIEVGSCRDINIQNNHIINFDGVGINIINCDGNIQNNILKKVIRSGVQVYSSPEGRTSIQNNIITENSRSATFGPIGLLACQTPEIWSINQIYPENSYVTTTSGKIYKCIHSGVSRDGHQPTTLTQESDDELVWRYIGEMGHYDQGEYDVQQNLVTLDPDSVVRWGFFVEVGTRLKWGNNTFPQHRPDNTQLLSLIGGLILSDKDNTFGGFAQPNEIDSDFPRTYSYGDFSNGQPARSFIHSRPPQTANEGYWVQSDKVWNVLPEVGNYTGWVCTSAGSPGVWAPFGYLGVSGTAATYGVPEPGNDAADNQVVLGSDSRLYDIRPPSAHHEMHWFGGSDPITPNSIQAFDIANNLSEVAVDNISAVKQNLQIRSFANFDMPTIPLTGDIITDQLMLFNRTTSAIEWAPLSYSTIRNKYVETIGDGDANPITVQHNLNSKQFFIQVYNVESNISTTNYTYIILDDNNIEIAFPLVPGNEQYNITIIS